jgi:hypothetical protein
MKFTEIDLFDELFTHLGEHDGKQTTYNVTALFKHAEAHKDDVQIVSVPVDEEHARYCITNRGAEDVRIKVLMDNPEYLKKPVLFIAMPDGSFLLADGTHRYIVFYIAKASYIPAYIVPWSMAEPFVVEDAPVTEEDALMGYSGIADLRKIRGGMQ